MEAWRLSLWIVLWICILCLLFLPLIWRELRHRKHADDGDSQRDELRDQTQNMKLDQIKFTADEIFKRVDRPADQKDGGQETQP